MDYDTKMTELKLSPADDNLSPVLSRPQQPDLSGTASDDADGLQRHLGNRHIQLLAIGGAVGTALFVSMGNGLAAAGPGSLFIAYFIWSFVVASVNNCITEMMVLQPVSGGFIRIAAYWFDDALGFMAGWNFFFFEVFAIPFKITAVNLVLSYWTDKIPIAPVCAACIVLYAVINLAAVRYFGEAEFWLSGGKVILIIMFFAFTLITMVGGNPQKDAYGFRYWSNPGAFAENPARSATGDLGRFEGFLAGLWSAAFIILGPEYISIAAAETKRPRTYLKEAFKTVYWRFVVFFLLGSLCVGIVLPWDDPQLQGVFLGTSRGGGTVAASPYVIAMSNMGIHVLPDIVNALLITSIFSAGNTFVYCATRTLYGMALEGRAPRIFSKTTKAGVPMHSFLAVICFGFLSFLQINQGSIKVISWLISLVTGCGMINYFTMCITFINYHKACKALGLDRKELPYYGWLQPGCAYLGAVSTFLVALFYGYTVFKPFSIEAFFQNYTMQLVSPILCVGWKVFKNTKRVKPAEFDLVWERPTVDLYEDSFLSPPTTLWLEIGQLFVDRQVLSLVKRLPFGLGDNSFTRYNFRGWEVPDRYFSHHEMGDAYVLVSPGNIWLYVADPDTVNDVLRRGNEFPRDTSVTAILDVFGPNISTAQGAQWQKHRRITASSFNDQNNVIVWSESVTVAHDILQYWTSKSAVQTAADDLRTLSLHVMSRADFGRSSKFQSQEENDAADLSSGMSYQNALKMILENCVLIFALGRKTLAHSWLPRKLQQLNEACISFQTHMTEVYEEEKQSLAEGKHVDRNFIASLVRASQDARLGGLTESEIYGNMFTFNFAGHDTTAHTFTFALYFLAANPGVQDWVSEEINHVMGERSPEEWSSVDFTRLKRCLAMMYETLRLYTPVPTSKIVDGNLPKPLVIGNKTIVLPPKTMIVPSYSSVQTDPKYWGNDSLEWRPSRFISTLTQSSTSAQVLDDEEFIHPRKGTFLAWSGGPRDCVGRKFSQVEFVAVMASLFRDWRVRPVLAEGETAEAARKRVLDQIETESAPVLLLQMLHPERCPLVWEKK